jgi:hypothetical protein
MERKNYREVAARGNELLLLCQRLQSDLDGVQRPDPGSFDPTKTRDDFARDISEVSLYVSALPELVTIMLELGALGEKLHADGLIPVSYGDDYARAGLNYLLKAYGVTTPVKGVYP